MLTRPSSGRNSIPCPPSSRLTIDPVAPLTRTAAAVSLTLPVEQVRWKGEGWGTARRQGRNVEEPEYIFDVDGHDGVSSFHLPSLHLQIQPTNITNNGLMSAVGDRHEAASGVRGSQYPRAFM
ncbi:hypothetical protein Naga_100445g2 [Nannochloropsis gaditana]|uniref:Uncharacterized protein n=1 Tax=Nannochloropsis gaditana TaxID=72520 RepID=W7TKU7_9STRA|nr:hypothetical protein Naga_100445g2 [Nannochloropsis gaditana]